MLTIRCDSHLYCPTNTDFINKSGYIRRAGFIPYMIHNNIEYILLGLSKDKSPVWADLGGRAENKETTLQTAIREFKEESRGVLPIDLNRINRVFITGKGNKPDQVIFLVQVDDSVYNRHINGLFQRTYPNTKYEDEMEKLQWIPYIKFLNMNKLSNSLKEVQKLLVN